MKKFILICLCFINLLYGCNKNKSIDNSTKINTTEVSVTEEQSHRTTDNPPIGMIEDYELAIFEKFNSPASENGLKNTKIYINGILTKIFNSNSSILGYITDENDNEWLLIIDSKLKSSKDDYKYLENNKVCVAGIYDGFSNIHKMPALTINRIFDYKSGDILGSKMFLKFNGDENVEEKDTNFNEKVLDNDDDENIINENKNEKKYNLPSQSNFKSFLYTIFDRYYGKKDYLFSGNKDDWNIVNTKLSDYTRSKFSGKIFEDNNWVRCDIIIEFTDKTNKEYSVKLLEINKKQILYDENNNELLPNHDEINENNSSSNIVNNNNNSNNSNSEVNQYIQDNRIRILRKEWVDKQFSSWDGSNYELNNLIKKNLNDENSFKHIQTKFIDINSDEMLNGVKSSLKQLGYNADNIEKWDILVQTEFSAKNAFNATIKNYGIGIIKYSTKSAKLIDIRTDKIM